MGPILFGAVEPRGWTKSSEGQTELSCHAGISNCATKGSRKRMQPSKLGRKKQQNAVVSVQPARILLLPLLSPRLVERGDVLILTLHCLLSLQQFFFFALEISCVHFNLISPLKCVSDQNEVGKTQRHSQGENCTQGKMCNVKYCY